MYPTSRFTSHRLRRRNRGSAGCAVEGLEGRRLFAMTLLAQDLDNNGTLDLLVQGDSAPDEIRIVDNDGSGSVVTTNDPTATLDTGSGPVVIGTTPTTVGGSGKGGAIEVYKLLLDGGDDVIDFELGTSWDDDEKSILAHMTYEFGLGLSDNDRFEFDTKGKDIRNRSDLTIEVLTGIGNDLADLEFDKIDRALVNVDLDMGSPLIEQMVVFPDGAVPDSTPDVNIDTAWGALDAAETNGLTGGSGDAVKIDFYGDIKNKASVGVNVRYEEANVIRWVDEVAARDAAADVGGFLNLSSLTLIIFHRQIDRADVEINIQGGSTSEIPYDVYTEQSDWFGPAINVVGVLFRSDVKTTAEVYVNYNGGVNSIDVVGVGLDRGFDLRDADMYINLQAGDNFDILAVACVDIQSAVSLATNEVSLVEFTAGSHFHYTLNLGEGGFRFTDEARPALTVGTFVPLPEQAYAMFGYDFFDDGKPGPVSDDDSDIISFIVGAFVSNNDIRVHKDAKIRGRMDGGTGDDDLYTGFGITSNNVPYVGNFDLLVSGGWGLDLVTYAFDKAGGTNLGRDNFLPAGKAVLDGGGEFGSLLGPLFAQEVVRQGDELVILVDDGKSRNRNFEIGGKKPNQ